MGLAIYPDIESLKKYQEKAGSDVRLYPVCAYLRDSELTSHAAYLKLAKLNDERRDPSFLLDSVATVDTPSRYVYIGVKPKRVIKTGASEGAECDPLVVLEREMRSYGKSALIHGIPPFSGGAMGYVSYDCVKYFEPKARREQADVMGLPESAFMLFDTVVVFDNVCQQIQIVTNIDLAVSEDMESGYAAAAAVIERYANILQTGEVEVPLQPPIKLNQEFTSNIGKEGYKSHVRVLKQHIRDGDIIQAVPSQRISRPTSLHPFNIYKHLRTLNPSPYMFYIDYVDFQVIGASPERLLSVDKDRKVVTHPIAGTIRRGATPDEDEVLAAELKNSLKDHAEHVMLVDLARNDINRVCDPKSTCVEKFLSVEKFSHVQHLVSKVSGTLRDDKTRFDAMRSVFPAGTVSGAPKVRAMELIAELEGETRGVYAGCIGFWSFDENIMDSCIALRTIVYRDGVAYLQAGGGIVFDSDETDEYTETMNKMLANHSTILQAERFWSEKVGSI
ncbi:anthranilate synthase TRP2 Ecym_4700 [Eremothecium cymbalariae DBVPG|uniref:anthranilate synthase n=1 Tax=Eremothecium cymbalariae (strain CBS 270.75 / DBVPG 7215 / KCTC 17166 / NRRL Y-17582) TaxID=931890 RepID=G8JSJ8_ERECY|nr:hypothetical protein Ecym_4700 [Eremothecium cymbalariae DBVPG\